MELIESVSMRDRILAEAGRRFVVHGYNGISMREIGEACGISKAALYYHFADKEDLIVAILEGYLDQTDQLIRSSRAEGGSARAQLARVVRVIFAQPPEKRSIIRLASQEMPNLGPAARQRFGAVYHDKFIGQFVDMISIGTSAGEFQAFEPHTTAWILLGMMYPFFYPAQDRETGDMERVIETILAVFFEGIVRPQEAG
jgi:AcrR family transcriptional regulator